MCYLMSQEFTNKGRDFNVPDFQDNPVKRLPKTIYLIDNAEDGALSRNRYEQNEGCETHPGKRIAPPPCNY